MIKYPGLLAFAWALSNVVGHFLGWNVFGSNLLCVGYCLGVMAVPRGRIITSVPIHIEGDTKVENVEIIWRAPQ